MMTLPPSWKACKRSRPSAGLPRVSRSVGRLDAVVDGVAHQVGQRVADGLDDRLVQLGFLALHVDAHLLAAGDGQVADHARELVPDVADRLHARLHDVGLQLGGQQVQPLHRAQEGGVFLGGAELHDLVAGQDQLADQGHQLVEQADIHADGAVGDARRCATPAASCERSAPARPSDSARGRSTTGGGRSTSFLRAAWAAAARLGSLASGVGTRSRFAGPSHAAIAPGSGSAPRNRRRRPSRSLRRLEHLPDGVHHGQQGAGDVGVEDQLAVAQLAEQVLGGVGDGLQLLQAQEAGRPLDRVQRAEGPGQRLALRRILFQRDQVEVELGQVFVRLEQEFADRLRSWRMFRLARLARR